MKRTVALLIAAALLLCCAACGQPGGASLSPSPSISGGSVIVIPSPSSSGTPGVLFPKPEETPSESLPPTDEEYTLFGGILSFDQASLLLTIEPLEWVSVDDTLRIQELIDAGMLSPEYDFPDGYLIVPYPEFTAEYALSDSAEITLLQLGVDPYPATLSDLTETMVEYEGGYLLCDLVIRGNEVVEITQIYVP